MSVPADIIEKYSCGCCMWLAAAIHNLMGWPMEAILQRDLDTVWIVHAWVLAPNGSRVDILGFDGADDFIGAAQTIESLSVEDVVRLTRRLDTAAIESAARDAQLYVLPGLLCG